jgi:tetratricopeptide (TPR) repeat protein/outer membrane receptor protein involved in Fe transport
MPFKKGNPTSLARLFLLTVFLLGPLLKSAADEQGKVLSVEGTVQFTREKTNWSAALPGQKLESENRLRTLALSRALLQLAELGRVRLDELTTLEVLPPRNAKSKGTLDLKTGALYFFTRDKPREFEIQTPQALAASRGTEFAVTLDADGRETFAVYDGEVDITNSLGAVTVSHGEEGIVEPGRPPRKTAVIEARRIVQWWLYYAAILDPDELSLTPARQPALAESLAAYRQGDLLRALRLYPENRRAESDDEQLFHAALLMAAGQVGKSEAILSGANSNSPIAVSLRRMMDTVQSRDPGAIAQPHTATEFLANSYLLQARYDLKAALTNAQKAVELSPNFGLGWERVAELEFSFGHIPESSRALEKALQLSPRNAQAWALKGFLLSAQNKWDEASKAFQRAIDLDPALSNGWLGRGLIKIRMGDKAGGREDLQTAAALEPNRSVLRSYLGKGFEHEGDDANTLRELALAKHLDPNDPTPWLYSALILRQQLRYNEAIADLEKSAELNDNRQVYRSRLLLDEDHAVRSASLATIYRNAGLDEVSVREAARAVNDDYANYSAHQFLAESFDALRDPTQFNLRYETAWFNELLLANLLSPVDGGNLSQNISQQEYSRLFAADQLGFSSDSEYRSDGQVREIASQYGNQGKFAYAVDLDYQHNDGIRPNNELSDLQWYVRAKYELTPHDSLFLLVNGQNYKSGDNFQYYNPNAIRTNLDIYAIPGVTNVSVVRKDFSFRESQMPIVLAGLHHEWSPGIHTLLLGGRLANDQRFSDSDLEELILQRHAGGAPTLFSQLFDVKYQSVFEGYTFELNQIFQTDAHLTILGGRYQAGTFHTTDQLTLVNHDLDILFNSPPALDDVTADFERISAYAYHTWEILPRLRITGGLSYDRITYPVNFRLPLVSTATATRDKWSPKVALVWNPRDEVTVRGVYTRSLGGVSFDESFRLEPAQLAGFSQAFRSLIPESVAGSLSAPDFETAGAAVDLKFPTKTYLGVQAEFLRSTVNSRVGVFDFNPAATPNISESTTPKNLEYTEPSLSLSLHQLVSDGWSFGAIYRFTQSKLHTRFPELDPTTSAVANTAEEANLHQAKLFLTFNHPSGFFSTFETLWYHQENVGYPGGLPGDDFFQHNFLAGYRLRRQRGELSLGVLNLAGTDYRLNPLNAYEELPRDRVFVARLKINF